MVAALRSYSSFANADVSPASLTQPAGSAAGDILVLFAASDQDGDTANYGLPSGFSWLTTSAPAGVHGGGTYTGMLYVATKTVSGSESWPLTFTTDTNSDTVGLLLAISGSSGIDGFTVINGYAVFNNATMVTNPLTTTTAGDLIILPVSMVTTGGAGAQAILTPPSGGTIQVAGLQSATYHATTLGFSTSTEASAVTNKTYTSVIKQLGSSEKSTPMAIAFKAAVSITAVSFTRGTTWNVRTAVSITRVVTWNVAGVLSSRSTTRSASWNVAAALVTVSLTRSTTWRVFAVATAPYDYTSFANADVSPASIPKPAVVNIGDTLFLVIESDQDGDVANYALPSGFTWLTTSQNTGVHGGTFMGTFYIATKIATGSEPWPMLLGTDTSTDTVGVMVAAHGTLDGYSAINGYSVADSAPITSQGLTTTQSGDLVLVFLGMVTLGGVGGQSLTGAPSGGTIIVPSLQSTKYHSTTLGFSALIEAGQVTAKTYTSTISAPLDGYRTTPLAVAFKLTLAPVTFTRSATWNVQGPVSLTRSTTWRVLSTITSASLTRSATWNVLASALPFATTVDATKHYIKDQFGQPWLPVGDSIWVAPSRVTTQAKINQYFSTRKAQGYNVVVIDVVDGPAKGGNPGPNYQTPDGVNVFIGGDISQLNPTYWARVDNWVATAATYGFTVILAIADGQDFIGTMASAGTTKCLQYGTAVGTRYKNVANLIYLLGEDYGYNEWSTYDPYMTQVWTGVRSQDTVHLMTLEYLSGTNPGDSSPWSYPYQNPTWRGLYAVDWAYAYTPTYNVIEATQVLADGPVFMGEANYEYGSNDGTNSNTPLDIRKQIGWSYGSGAGGYIHGNEHVWPMVDGTWQTEILTATGQMVGTISNWLRTLSWWKLSADISGTFFTAGRGTKVTGGGVNSSSYGVAALANDQSFGLAYVCQAGTVTFDTTKVIAYSGATWVDPSDPSHTVAPTTGGTASARTFTHPGNNNAGSPDWYLLLQGAGPALVSTTRSTSWNVAAPLLTAVSTTRITSWAICTPVSTNRATMWQVRSLTSATRSSSWNLLAPPTPVTLTRATSWDVVGAVTLTRPTSWTVRALVTVTRPTYWSLRSSVTLTRDASWNVTVAASISRATAWDIYRGVSTARTTSWYVEGPITSVSLARSTGWVVYSRVSASRSTSWQADGRVSLSRIARWNIDSDLTVIVIDGVRHPVVDTWVIVDGVKHPVVNVWEIVGGVKYPIVEYPDLD